MYVVLLLISVIISSFNWKISPSLFTLGPLSFSGLSRHRIRKRYIVCMAVLAAVTVFRINAGGGRSTVGGVIPREGVVGSGEIGQHSCAESGNNVWFDTDYGYCRFLTITNNHPSKILLRGDIVGYEIDLGNLVSAGKVLPAGDDLLIVSRVPSDPVPVLQSVIPSGSTNTMIYFALEDDVAPSSSDNRYVLYYGSDVPKARPALSDRVITDIPYRITGGTEGTPQMSLVRNRRWFLTAPPETQLPQLTLTLTVRDGRPDQEYRYEIRDTSDAGELIPQSDAIFFRMIDVSDFAPGAYTVSVFQADRPEVRSRLLTFFISHPLYVAATLDWEGWGVPAAVFDRIRDLSSRHNELPITHFFSPRVFLPTVTPAVDTQQLVGFLTSRTQLNGDEIALHLHMHFDMIEAAGLTPKTEPAWGYRSQEGYDVATTAYKPEEFRQLLAWAKDQFAHNGLPAPVGYRAGGWFANVTVLRALRDSGFLYDSSGRENPKIGPFADIPWDLSASTQPYYPSANNQNATGFDAINLLEIPNNGGNTNEFPAGNLLENLRNNFDGEPLREPAAVVYLSHPQWYTTEFPRLDETLRGVDNILYELDRGPAVYTTVRSIYDIWTQ
jgi:hypothetical protein